MKLRHAFAAAAAALSIAGPASAATFNWNPQSWDVAQGDFNNATQTFSGVVADQLDFFDDNFTGPQFTGPQVHSHGGPMTWSITATVDGLLQTLYTGSFTSAGEVSIVGLAPISFTQGVVTSVGFTSSPGQQQSYHGFMSGTPTTFTLNAVGTSPVPEPATWAFMIIGFGAVGASLRAARRQRAVRAAA